MNGGDVTRPAPSSEGTALLTHLSQPQHPAGAQGDVEVIIPGVNNGGPHLPASSLTLRDSPAATPPPPHTHLDP